MAEDNDRFTKEETFVLGDRPYFPSEKVAKLLDVNPEYIDGILNVIEIAKHTIEVWFKGNDEFKTYIDPEGCLLLAMNSDVKKVGEELKVSIATLMSHIFMETEEKITEYCESPEAHRFVKALFGFAEAERIENFWGNMTVQ